MRRPLAHAALVAASLCLAVVLGEAWLRLAGHRFSVLAFLPPGSGSDARPYHVAALDPRVSATEPVTVFDPDLLWRPNPAASFQLDERGLRGTRVTWPRPVAEVVILALGDSNTLGPLHAADHWPGYLQALADLNPGRSRVLVANAGVYGYTSLQGLRRFRRLLPLRPQVAYWCFGANDAHRVPESDAAWAARAGRLRWLAWSRLALFVAQRLWSRVPEPGPALEPRVSVSDYRRHVDSFVAEARAHGVRPVLLTRPYLGTSDRPGHWMTDAPAYNAVVRDVAVTSGADWVDVHGLFEGDAASFADESHFNRRGHQRLAQVLAGHLAERGVLGGARLYRAAVDLGAAPDHWPELGAGWWRREAWVGVRAGRWSGARAELVLERSGAEGGLLVELSVSHPSGRACGRWEVGGRRLASFCAPSGRWTRVLDVGGVPGSVLEIALVAEEPFVPAQSGGDAADLRRLGFFVHRIGLEERAPPPEAGPDQNRT